jgi:hypothetical protein
MQKKLVFTLLLMVVFVCGVFAEIDFSVGGGGLFDYSLRNGMKLDVGNDKTEYKGIRNMSFGGFIFFDVTYAELSVYYAYGSLSSVQVDGEGTKTVSPKESNDPKTSASQLGFSLLGKYPIKMGSFTFFPLLGVDYNIVVSQKTKSAAGEQKEKDPGHFSQFGFLGGIGGDINLGKSVFLRMEGLFHMRLPSKYMKDAVDEYLKIPGTKKEDISATWGMGPQIKIGIGYRF